MEPMARSVGWFIVKWLIIPAALAAVGYYVVGPRIGNIKPSPPSEQQTPPPPQNAPVHESTTASNQTSYPSPDVTVTRGNANSVTPSTSHRRHRRRTSERPKPEAPTNTPPDVSNKTDEGGSGGAATGGGEGTTGGDTGNHP